MYFLNKHLPAFCGLICLLFFYSCNENIDSLLKTSDITKEQREELGDQIRIALAVNDHLFPVLPRIPPFDTTVYWYIQGLYDQVTFEMHQDGESPQEERWNIDRNWQVTILDSEQSNAFSVPGGHIYLTTGLLKRIRTEHELYYVLAFEAILMNDRYLLNRLATQFDPAFLIDFSTEGALVTGTAGIDVATAVSNLSFEREDVLEIDNKAGGLICRSSLFALDGILSLMSNIDAAEGWFLHRPSYTGRAAYIVDKIMEQEAQCQQNRIRTNGGYSRYVLNRLP